jgi:chromate transporter
MKGMKLMILLKLLYSFIKIGIFSFGGGYAMIPFIENEIISNNHWLEMNEFIDIIAIAQLTPGSIAINSATFVGYNIEGLKGSLITTFGVVLFPVIMVILLSIFFYKYKNSKFIKGILMGLHLAVISLIIIAALSVGKYAIVDFRGVFIAAVVLIFIQVIKVHYIYAILIAGSLGIILY